jgi:hypothetical protein
MLKLNKISEKTCRGRRRKDKWNTEDFLALLFNEFQGRNKIFRLFKTSQNNKSILNYAFLFMESKSFLTY